jgi:hypothetical protein
MAERRLCGPREAAALSSSERPSNPNAACRGVLPYLPTAIKGKLFGNYKSETEFKRITAAASKRLNRFLNDCGIVDPRKVVHTLRHRAQDQLRAAECPQDIRWALLGHEEKTVAEDYGKGFSVPQLKRWIDRIGFLTDFNLSGPTYRGGRRAVQS